MPHPFRFRPDMRGQTGTDELIAHLARRQHGVVARAQLIKRGVGRRAIDHRIERRRLFVVQRGVYAVGHDLLPQKGVWMAAALCARGAISHRTAGTAWEILSAPLLEVTAPRSRRRPGLRIYCHCLEADEVVTMEGIPVTTVSRTLLDLAAVLPPDQLERAVNEAEVQGLLRPLRLQRLLERYPRRHGTYALSAILDARTGMKRSELEAKFSRLIRSADLPRPELNRLVTAGAQPFECDCVWRAQRLIVELDGRAYHATAAAFERDRARDRRLQAAGWTVVRVTWRQLRDEPETVVRDLRALLGESRRPPDRDRGRLGRQPHDRETKAPRTALN